MRKKKTAMATTVGACLRAAEKKLAAAKLTYGHGTFSAREEALFLVMETLRLPLEEPERFFGIRVTEGERGAVADVIARRIATRLPAAYLLKKMYLQGLPFYVDERVIVPRSFIAEIMAGDFGFVESPKRILDLCTGSGCLAVLAARMFPCEG